ncbi:MAG: hypothetical protein LBF72_03130 [Holosporales bacterium]|jgi:hypothetical protein|nr:hypothetical protein [Holosporales bacterium]
MRWVLRDTAELTKDEIDSLSKNFVGVIKRLRVRRVDAPTKSTTLPGARRCSNAHVHKYAALLRDVSPARKLSMTGYIHSHKKVCEFVDLFRHEQCL